MTRSLTLLTFALVVAAVVAAVGGATAVGVAGPPPPNYPKKIVYVPYATLEHTVATGVTGAPGGTNELIPRDLDLGIRMSLGKKSATPPITPAEVHSTFGHVFRIEEGEGTLVLGGELVNPTEGGRGEWRGTSIKGGQEFQMKKGDMITVQVGMPHQWVNVPKSVSYLAYHSFPDKNQPKP